MKRPRVRVLTAHADEPQLPTLVEAVSVQTGVDVDHRQQRCASFRAAQHWLHGETLRSEDEVDWVLILDGDMVPVDHQAIARLVQSANERGETRRLSTPVYDHYTRSQIMGVHLLAPSAVNRDLDVAPVVHDVWIGRMPGTLLRWVDAPQVRHAPEPSLDQAIRFGLQRGNKARRARHVEDYWMVFDRLAHVQRRMHDRPSTAVLFAAVVGVVPNAFGPEVAAAMDAFDDRTHDAVALVSRAFVEDDAAVQRALGRAANAFAIARLHARTHGASPAVVRAYLRARYLTWHSPVGKRERLRPRCKRVESLERVGDRERGRR